MTLATVPHGAKLRAHISTVSTEANGCQQERMKTTPTNLACMRHIITDEVLTCPTQRPIGGCHMDPIFSRKS
jgi:hypothetical protein